MGVLQISLIIIIIITMTRKAVSENIDHNMISVIVAMTRKAVFENDTDNEDRGFDKKSSVRKY